MDAPTKKIWLLCLVLAVVFVGMVIFQLKGDSLRFPKKVSGSKNDLSTSDVNLVKIPQKNPNFSEPNILAKSVILLDEKSLFPLYSKNPTEEIPVASTTKIMTALVVLEDFPDKLNDTVTITPSMINIEGSDIQLRAGEQITVENLLKGLLIMSGNDTAFSLATYFGGKDAFVAKMNDKAAFLGLKNTQYKDPAGLDDNGHSTASNLAVLSAYAMRNPKFWEIVRIPTVNISSIDGEIVHELKNSNRLIRSEEQFYFPLAIGIKTGFTNDAGHCLVSEASKDNHDIIGVVLNTEENTLTASAKESKKLLEWGFANWSW